MNNLEIFNELSLLAVTYPALIFTDFITDLTPPETTYNIGWFVIFIILLNILVNMLVVIYQAFLGLIRVAKIIIFKIKVRRSIENILKKQLTLHRFSTLGNLSVNKTIGGVTNTESYMIENKDDQDMTKEQERNNVQKEEEKNQYDNELVQKQKFVNMTQLKLDLGKLQKPQDKPSIRYDEDSELEIESLDSDDQEESKNERPAHLTTSLATGLPNTTSPTTPRINKDINTVSLPQGGDGFMTYRTDLVPADESHLTTLPITSRFKRKDTHRKLNLEVEAQR